MDPLLTYATPPRQLVTDALTTGVEPIRRVMLATADGIDTVAASADAALTPAIQRYGGVHIVVPELLLFLFSDTT